MTTHTHMATTAQRDPYEILTDDSGQLTVEWILVMAAFVLPVGLSMPLLLDVVYYYYYRIAGLISLPFP